MLIDFNNIEKITITEMNKGTGTISAKMYMDEQGKVISSIIPVGSSIGLHKHETSDDINYIISGIGEAICDGKIEYLKEGTCHICKKGSEHSITNVGKDDLVMITVIVER